MVNCCKVNFMQFNNYEFQQLRTASFLLDQSYFIDQATNLSLREHGVSVSRINAGAMNETFLLEDLKTPSSFYIIKFLSNDALNFGCSREAEYKYLETAFDAGIAPESEIIQSGNSDILLLSIVKGVHPTTINNDLITELCKSLKILQGLTNVGVNDYNTLQISTDILNILKKNNSDNYPNFNIRNEITKLQRYVFCLSQFDTSHLPFNDKFFPGHNDIKEKNLILTDENKVVMLDWEFAGRTHMFHDFACFCARNKLNEDQVKVGLGILIKDHKVDVEDDKVDVSVMNLFSYHKAWALVLSGLSRALQIYRSNTKVEEESRLKEFLERMIDIENLIQEDSFLMNNLNFFSLK